MVELTENIERESETCVNVMIYSGRHISKPVPNILNAWLCRGRPILWITQIYSNGLFYQCEYINIFFTMRSFINGKNCSCITMVMLNMMCILHELDYHFHACRVKWLTYTHFIKICRKKKK